MLSQELNRLGVQLRRARQVFAEHPGVAVALAEELLRSLDRLSSARRADSRLG